MSMFTMMFLRQYTEDGSLLPRRATTCGFTLETIISTQSSRGISEVSYLMQSTDVKEIWKDIPGEDGFYQVSNLGRTKSCKRLIKNNKPGFEKIIHRDLILKTSGRSLQIRNTVYQLDELVVSLFIRSLKEHEFIVHKDGDVNNLRVDNLEIKCSSDYGTDWRPIPGFLHYEISREGQIRLLRNNLLTPIRRECIINPSEDDDGYLRAFIYFNPDVRNGKGRFVGVHRLVCLAFLPNPDNLSSINHKDGNKKNNNVDNLEWCTVEYNNRHARETGLNNPSKTIPIGKIKRNLSYPVRCITTGEIFYSCNEAERKLGLYSGAIHGALYFNKNHKVKGYEFELLDKDEYKYLFDDIPYYPE